MASVRRKNFISDHETVVDLLYYEAIANTVVSFVRDDPQTPVTVGVHGDWGAGKSSVLKMTEAALAKHDRTLCLWFNGWVFEGFEDAKAVVLETIVAELKRARPTSTKVADAAKKLFKRIQWLKVAHRAGGLAVTAVTGVPTPEIVGALFEKVSAILKNPADEIKVEDLQSVAEGAGEFLKASDPSEDSVPEHMHAFRKEFDALLEAAEVDQLVILIDDLDRCLPETAIATLEAIRLFLFVPRTAFVIGADEAMIEYSVRRHFPDLAAGPTANSYARNYLEKLIQVPFRIPAMGITETRTYITLLLVQSALGEDDSVFKKLLASAREDLRRPWQSRGLEREGVKLTLGSIAPEVEQALLLSRQISHILNEGTRGNPRQIKRFLNSMALRRAIARERGFGDDIQVPVLAKLMLAERFATDFYDKLARLATVSADGKVAALARLEDIVAAPAARQVKDKKKDTDKEEATKPAAEPSEVEDWSKNDWIRAWAQIEPYLGATDLRAYVFVTRDKRSFYLGPALVGRLDTLVELLLGNVLAVKSAKDQIQNISEPEAQQIFDVLRARALSSEKLQIEPPGVAGLVALVQEKHCLQGAMLEFLKELPAATVGPWAPTTCGNAFTSPDMKVAFDNLLATWGADPVNKSLQIAANMLRRSLNKS